MSLNEYRKKRDFKVTPEPSDRGAAGNRIFVVQLHHASHRHYDFRLELDGVLKSWAIPKGPSFDPSVKRLAVEVEDHPIAYAAFEGDIPKGNYGAGHVDVFDRGTWAPIGNAREGLANGDLKFTLHGDVLRGSWALVRTRRVGTKNQWLLIKHRDAYAHDRDVNAFVDANTDRPIPLSRRQAIWKGIAAAPASATVAAASVKTGPGLTRVVRRRLVGTLAGVVAEVIENAAFAPELCRAQDQPSAGDCWLHEVKWDGYRLVATVVNGQVRLWSRNAIEWTAKAPDLAAAIASLKLDSAQLDGEMIVLRDGRADFNALQARLAAETDAPLVYMLFDLPHLDGKSLRDVALIDRKSILAALLAKQSNAQLRYSEHHVGHGKDVFAQATTAGLEGIVSKRADSVYRGARSGAWVKIKVRPSGEFIVVGFTEPKGGRAGIGALLLAKPDADGLVYVGRVGSGIDDAQLHSLRERLMASVVEQAQADIALMARRDVKLARWVKPTLVVEVFYQGVGGQGLLRQAAFKTIRVDKTPRTLASDSAIEKTMTKVKRTANKAGAGGKKKAPAQTATVTVTHAEREVFPDSGITKGDVADYYRAVSPWLLTEIGGRPLSVVRCPDGAGKPCFFQKHAGRGWGDHVRRLAVNEKGKRNDYLFIDDETGLLELVQMNVLEFHPWGAKVSEIEYADRIVFDLDPHASVQWPRVIAAVRDVREQLESIGLRSFLRTSGGKGLHVVVPLEPPAPWDAVKRFAQAVAEAMAALRPAEFVSVAGEKNREGKIFIDWLRNHRGATSVASYSLRARATAGVAMPIEWTDLGKIKRGDAFTIKNAITRIRKRKADPWADIDGVRQGLPDIG